MPELSPDRRASSGQRARLVHAPFVLKVWAFYLHNLVFVAPTRTLRPTVQCLVTEFHDRNWTCVDIRRLQIHHERHQID